MHDYGAVSLNRFIAFKGRRAYRMRPITGALKSRHAVNARKHCSSTLVAMAIELLLGQGVSASLTLEGDHVVAVYYWQLFSAGVCLYSRGVIKRAEQLGSNEPGRTRDRIKQVHKLRRQMKSGGLYVRGAYCNGRRGCEATRAVLE